jgi:RecA-family ATPase
LARRIDPRIEVPAAVIDGVRQAIPPSPLARTNDGGRAAAVTVTPLRPDPAPPRASLCNTDAEQGLLGALLIDNALLGRVSGFLRGEHFGEAVHGRIFDAIRTLSERGQTANSATLRTLFDQDGALSKVGGAKYLRELVKGVVTLINTEDYGHEIHDLYRRRQLRAVWQDGIADVEKIELGRPVTVIAADHAARLSEIVSAPTRLRLVNPVTLAGLPVPKRQWLVEPWIPMRRATGLYGVPGAGKTLLMQMLATACATGQKWLGRYVRRCKSILHYCEDDLDEMHGRQEEINRYYRCSFRDLDDIRWLPRLGDENTLMTFDAGGRACLSALFHELLAAAREFGARLIVEDTLADIFGGNENDRGHARRFVQEGLGRMARDADAAVVACAHPSLTGLKTDTGSSGTTGWRGGYRADFTLSFFRDDQGQPADSDARVLTRKKSNWARVGETITMHWVDGVLIADQPPSGIDEPIERRNVESVFLELLEKREQEGRPVSANPQSGNYAPKAFAQRPDNQRYTKRDFSAAMETLFAEGLIFSQVYGRPSHPHSRILRRTNGRAAAD